MPVYFASRVADREDSFRSRFIAEQLKQLVRGGAARYYYDGYCDSFMFDEGITPKCGLYATNFALQQRTPRFSAEFSHRRRRAERLSSAAR